MALDWPEGRVALLYVGDEEIPGDPLPVMNPPMGVQVLATLLRRNGVAAEVFDDRLMADPVAEIVAFAPDLVGLSYLSTASAEADRLAGRLRAAGLRTLAGGVHATVRADDLVAAGTYDCVVTGDGEGALLDLCGRLARGEPLPARLDGVPWGDLDALAPIDAFAVYAPVYGAPDRIPAVSLQIGRGCPMNCQFCELAHDAGTYALPSAYGRRRPEAVVAELETYLTRWSATYVVLLDSIATLHQEALTAVIRHLAARGGVSLQLNAHVNKFGAAIAAEVARLDDVSVWFGFESGSDRMLRRLKKGHTAEAAWEAARRALDAGARAGGQPADRPAGRDRRGPGPHRGLRGAHPRPRRRRPGHPQPQHLQPASGHAAVRRLPRRGPDGPARRRPGVERGGHRGRWRGTGAGRRLRAGRGPVPHAPADDRAPHPGLRRLGRPRRLTFSARFRTAAVRKRAEMASDAGGDGLELGDEGAARRRHGGGWRPGARGLAGTSGRRAGAGRPRRSAAGVAVR